MALGDRGLRSIEYEIDGLIMMIDPSGEKREELEEMMSKLTIYELVTLGDAIAKRFKI